MDCALYQQGPFRLAAGSEFRPGGLPLSGELARSCGLERGHRALDLGCGVGSTASYLAREWGLEVVGLDASPTFITEAQTRDPAVDWVVGLANDLPFPDACFDVVFCECFLSAAHRPGEVLREVHRVLARGGRLAVSDMYLRAPGKASPSALALPATCLNGATGVASTLSMLDSCGFALQLWRDRSESLKGLMASLIMEYGSAAAFWEAAASSDASAAAVDTSALAEVWSAARPGYYLLVAEARALAEPRVFAEAGVG